MTKGEQHMIITNEKYGDGFKLDEYKGAYSLVACKQGKDGKVYPEWAIMQGKDKEPRTKDDGSYMVRPTKVTLGNSREEAIRNLREILAELGDEQPEAQYTGPSVAGGGFDGDAPDDDIPF
jgi:hypothetical protein